MVIHNHERAVIERAKFYGSGLKMNGFTLSTPYTYSGTGYLPDFYLPPRLGWFINLQFTGVNFEHEQVLALSQWTMLKKNSDNTLSLYSANADGGFGTATFSSTNTVTSETIYCMSYRNSFNPDSGAVLGQLIVNGEIWIDNVTVCFNQFGEGSFCLGTADLYFTTSPSRFSDFTKCLFANVFEIGIFDSDTGLTMPENKLIYNNGRGVDITKLQIYSSAKLLYYYRFNDSTFNPSFEQQVEVHDLLPDSLQLIGPPLKGISKMCFLIHREFSTTPIDLSVNNKVNRIATTITT